jgi:hypothetical protein
MMRQHIVLQVCDQGHIDPERQLALLPSNGPWHKYREETGLMRSHSVFRGGLAATALALGAATSLPASAETLQELDALSDLSADEEAGIAAARDQAARGEYLEALATLERVLAVHPKSRDARLIHAVYLCQVDDQRGGLVEIDQLKAKHYASGVLDEARNMCRNGG